MNKLNCKFYFCIIVAFLWLYLCGCNPLSGAPRFVTKKFPSYAVMTACGKNISTLTFYRISDGKIVWKADKSWTSQLDPTTQNKLKKVKFISGPKNGRVLVGCWNDIFLFRWENGEPKLEKVIKTDEPSIQVTNAELSPDGKKIALLKAPYSSIHIVGFSVVSTCDLYVVNIENETRSLIAKNVNFFNEYNLIWSSDSNSIISTKGVNRNTLSPDALAKVKKKDDYDRRLNYPYDEKLLSWHWFDSTGTKKETFIDVYNGAFLSSDNYFRYRIGDLDKKQGTGVVNLKDPLAPPKAEYRLPIDTYNLLYLDAKDYWTNDFSETSQYVLRSHRLADRKQNFKIDTGLKLFPSNLKSTKGLSDESIETMHFSVGFID